MSTEFNVRVGHDGSWFRYKPADCECDPPCWTPWLELPEECTGCGEDLQWGRSAQLDVCAALAKCECGCTFVLIENDDGPAVEMIKLGGLH
jgi:hypothetical protein